MQIEELAIMRQEPPRRLLSAMKPYFDKEGKKESPYGAYGYQSVSSVVRALRSSIYRYEEPTVVALIGDPGLGKRHMRDDLIDRLKGTFQLIKREFGVEVPTYIEDWGPIFSGLKAEGVVTDMNAKFGQFGNVFDQASELFGKLAAEVLQEHQKRRAVLFMKSPTIAGGNINGQFVLMNLANSVIQNLVRREGAFESLEYRVITIGAVATPNVLQHNNQVRREAEQLVDDPKALVEYLKSMGEKIITPTGRMTRRYRAMLVDYILDSANEQATEKIMLAGDTFDVMLYQAGKIVLDPSTFREDRLAGGYSFYDRRDRTHARALAMRYLLSDPENFGLSQAVALFINGKELNEIILGHKTKVVDVVRKKYPEIRKNNVRNK